MQKSRFSFYVSSILREERIKKKKECFIYHQEKKNVTEFAMTRVFLYDYHEKSYDRH